MLKSPKVKTLSRDGVYLSIILLKLSAKYFGSCLGFLYIGNKSHFCFLILISIGIVWMSLGISRSSIFLNSISSFIYTKIPPLLLLISSLIGLLKPFIVN